MLVSSDALLILFPIKEVNCYCALYLKSSVVHFCPRYFVWVEISGRKKKRKVNCKTFAVFWTHKAALLCFGKKFLPKLLITHMGTNSLKKLPGSFPPVLPLSLPVSRFRIKSSKVLLRNHFSKVLQYFDILYPRHRSTRQPEILAMTNICLLPLFQPFIFLIAKSFYASRRGFCFCGWPRTHMW